MLRAMQRGHAAARGDVPAEALNKQCYTLAAKALVLLRCGLVDSVSVVPAAVAVRRLCHDVVSKESRVRPSGVHGARLLPGAIAVDGQDPFHANLSSAIKSVGGELSVVLAPYLSESSIQALHDVVSSLGAAEVLRLLFGDPMKPANGIDCAQALDELLAACKLFLEQQPEPPASAPSLAPPSAKTGPRVAFADAPAAPGKPPAPSESSIGANTPTKDPGTPAP